MNKYESASIEEIKAEVERIARQNKQHNELAIDVLISYAIIALVGGIVFYAFN